MTMVKVLTDTVKIPNIRVLRIIFGPKKDDVAGEWWKLHRGELHNLYLSSSIIR
jgi:hypothetical protein